MGIFDHSSRSTFVRSHTDVGREGLALTLHSNSSQGCSIGLGSGPCLYGAALCTAAVMLEQEGPSPNCSHKVGRMELSNISWYAEAFRVAKPSS